jgi:TonB family protein
MKALLLIVSLLLVIVTLSHSNVMAQQSPSPQVNTKKLTEAESAELAEASRDSVRVVQLYKDGKYDEALPLARRVLIAREKILGPDDGRTAGALINLAELYLAKRNYSEAEKLYGRLLSLYEKTFGSDATQTAMIVDSLALTDYFKGDFKSAESLYVRAVSMREHELGPERLDLGQAVFRLAEFYRSRRNYARAEPLYLRAIAINDRELAKDDPVATHLIQRYECFVYESDGVSAGQKKLRQFHEARKAMSQTPPADHGEVLNGRAISLPAPGYPEEARSVRASGVVLVQVTIDTGGKVIDAKVVCGHPVFAKPSIEAAYRARFTPTKLSGMPVQVNGTIIYNFVAQ